MKIAGLVLAAAVAFAAAGPPSPQRQPAAFGPFGPQDPRAGGARPGQFYMGRGGAPIGAYQNHRFAPGRVKRQIGSSSAAAAAAAGGVGMGYGMMPMGYGMMGYGYPMIG